jgi:transcriptional regulator with GAF, ATPase, and Fis domain
MLPETEDGTKRSAHGASPPRPGVILVHAGLSPAFRPFAFSAHESPFLVGREGPVGSVADDRRLSRRHAEIAWSPDGWLVRDLDSRNGTFVDGVAVHGEVVVPSPRVIRTGDTVLVPCADVAAVSYPSDVAGPVVGSALRRALDDVARAASGSDTLLVLGESGTGKELAAHRFHERGPNARGSFVAVNCAAIPAGLAERLLFGAKRGAYSGSGADSIGHLQAADGGVLFLDEIAELDPQVQAKLLRVLETREVVPLGASHGLRVSTRIVAATHQDLAAAVAERRFRADLYHRLAPPVVTLPPLRERLDEIAQHVAAAVSAASPALAVQAQLVEACLLRRWPGNVRELRKQVHAAALEALGAKDDRVRVEHLPESAGAPMAPAEREPSVAAVEPQPTKTRPAARAPGEPREYVKWSKAITREILQKALVENEWNASAAARSLGMPRQQLYREMARLSVKPPVE